MKKIIKSIACICLTLAVAIGSCFGAKNMSKNFTFLGTSCNKASASSLNFPISERFVGSNLIFAPTTFFTSIPSFNGITFKDFSRYLDSSGAYRDFNYAYIPLTFSLILDSSQTEGYNRKNIYFGVKFNYLSDVTIGYQESIYEYDGFYYNSWLVDNPNTDYSLPYPDSSFLNTTKIISSSSLFYNLKLNTISNSTRVYYNIGFSIHKTYDNDNLYKNDYNVSNIKKVVITNSNDFENIFSVVPSFTNSNIVTYTDSNGFNYSFYIPNPFNDSLGTYETRIYYLTPEGAFTDNSYYEQGLYDGYNNGYNDGETQGYNNGYSQGETEGYNNGYTQGLESSERLGFPALITSVIDVPVKVFTSLFNFEILGVNILTFLTSLLTIALILAIVRKVKSD